MTEQQREQGLNLSCLSCHKSREKGDGVFPHGGKALLISKMLWKGRCVHEYLG